MTVAEMLEYLRAQEIETWFDLGLFIDRFRENRKTPTAEFADFFEDFREAVRKGGIGFVTYNYGIDGVTIEINKYSRCFRELLPDVPIHFIGGEFLPEGKHLIDPSYKTFTMEAGLSFYDWPLFQDFFLTKLERGSPEYNALIHRYWSEVLRIAEELGEYVEKQELNLLYLVNVCSNPGNVSLSLAVVVISECLGIPVISNNHDFYWEGGNRSVDIVTKHLPKGPRDFFFTNSDIGEFFSLIEVLFPWESRSWISVNINKNQSRHIIEMNGHNPANVCEVNTAVDINSYRTVSNIEKAKAFVQVSDILARYGPDLRVYTADEVLEHKLVTEEEPRPVLIGARGARSFDFGSNNIIFLQPTRVMARKRIEVVFDLLSKLFTIEAFDRRFLQRKSHSLSLP